MMGYQPPPQENLFYVNIHLEKRVRENHPLRKINELIDFDFIYKEVEDKYGKNGNVSVPPPIILKLMLLLILYNVRSERELMETLPERLDWLWFLKYNLDSEIPHHSILSKARSKWGEDAFKRFFERIVMQCVEAGLVDGSKIFIDASLIDADASNNSVVDTHSLKRYLKASYREFEKRLDGQDIETQSEDSSQEGLYSDVNKRYVSTTDPDASIIRQGGKAKLRYKTHRAVDPLHEVITAVEVTPGAVNEAHEIFPLIDTHEANTNTHVTTVVADSMYGTIENFLTCYEKGIKAHIPLLKKTHENKGRKEGIFPEEMFTYDPKTDTMVCPAGKSLQRRTFHKHRNSTEYIGSKKGCGGCLLKPQCTRNKLGRSVHRHVRKEELDYMFTLAKSPQAKKDIKTRKHLMERSYARSTRYNFDRARWRGLGKVTIREYLVSAIQNIMALIRYVKNPPRGVLTGISIETIKQLSSFNGRYVSLVFSWTLRPKLSFARSRVWV